MTKHPCCFVRKLEKTDALTYKTEHFKSDDLLTIACYQDFSTRAGNDRSSSKDQFSFCWQSKEGFKSLALSLCGFTKINQFLATKKTALTSRHKINKTHTQIFGLQLTKFFFQLEKQSLGETLWHLHVSSVLQERCDVDVLQEHQGSGTWDFLLKFMNNSWWQNKRGLYMWS